MEITGVRNPEAGRVPPPPRSLRLLHAFLFVVAGVLAVVSVVSVLAVGSALLGDRPLYAQGITGDVTIEHERPTGGVIVQSPNQVVVDEYPSPRFLHAGVQVQLQATAAKVVAAISQLIVLAFAWFSLVQLLRLVRTALGGAPLSTVNARRLERLGWAAILYPIVSWFVGRSVLFEVIDEFDVGVSGFLPTATSSFSPTWLAVGLLLLGLGWVFRWGSELADFDAAAI